MNIRLQIYQAKNGFIYLSCGNGCTNTALTLQQIVDLGLDLYSVDDFSLEAFKKAYPTPQSSQNTPETETTADGLLEQAVRAMLEKGGIQFKPFSWCFGKVDVTVSSEVFTEKEVVLSVDEDDWNGGPTKCVAKELAQAITAGRLRFIPCKE